MIMTIEENRQLRMKKKPFERRVFDRTHQYPSNKVIKDIVIVTMEQSEQSLFEENEQTEDNQIMSISSQGYQEIYFYFLGW
jgi:hypothetical protein